MQGMRVYGEEVIPLSKLVKEFCLKQGNMKETAVFQQLVYARWAWKELFRRNIWGIKNAVINVDCKKHTFCLPEDCERLINISVKDHSGKIQPLTCDPSLSTVEILCVKPACSCPNCKGNDTLCGLIDTVSYTTEMVTIQGQEYPLQTWTRYNGNGAIQIQQSIPSLQAGTSQVIYTTEISTVCNVEVTEEGCIRATDSNMELFRTYCGCGNIPDQKCGIPFNRFWRSVDLIPQPYNYFGYWNYNAEDRNIIHIFRHENGNVRHHDHNRHEGIYQVIVSYQTNGDTTGEEILVPQYAQHAMDAGMIWQQIFFNNRASSGNKQFAWEQWLGAKVLVNRHLNPIRLEILEKLQTELKRW